MEFFLSDFMYSHTHISNEVPIFLLFFIKRKDNEGDYVAKLWMIKNLPIGWVPPPPPKLGLKHKLIVYTQFKVMQK